MTQTAAGKPSLPDEIRHSALLQLLSNTLILCHTTPYLPVNSILALAATSRTFRYLLYETPQVFRYLDLRPVKSARFDIEGIDRGGETWRNVQLDENLTEDEYALPDMRQLEVHSIQLTAFLQFLLRSFTRHLLPSPPDRDPV